MKSKFFAIFILSFLYTINPNSISILNTRCPCIEANLCLTSSTIEIFQSFQEAFSDCSSNKIRCCSEEMMLLSLIELQPTAKEESDERFGQQFNKADLPCKSPRDCSEIYGSSPYHFVHISPQRECQRRGQVRCVVTKLQEQFSLPCVDPNLCYEKFGTKLDHFLTYGFMRPCEGQDRSKVRCVRRRNQEPSFPGGQFPSSVNRPPCQGFPDLESTVITSSPIRCNPSPTSKPEISFTTPPRPSFVTQTPSTSNCAPGFRPNLSSIVLSSFPIKCIPSPTKSTTTRPGVIPNLDSIVITSSPIRTNKFSELNPPARSVKITEPGSVVLQIANIKGPVVGADSSDDEDKRFRLLLQLAQKFYK